MNAKITITLDKIRVTLDDDAYGPIVAATLNGVARAFREGNYALPCLMAVYDGIDGEEVGNILVEAA